MNRNLFSFGTGNIAVAFLFLGLSALLLAESFGISGVGGRFPRSVATAGLLISALDLLQSWVGTSRRAAPTTTDRDVEGAEVVAILWPVLFVLMIWALGFIVAIPLFMALFMYSRGNVGLMQGLIATSALFVFVYLVFLQLLGVRLHGGLFL